MKPISKIIEDFLEDQKNQLNPNNIKKYSEVMILFEDYINYSTYQLFDEEELNNLDQEFLDGKKLFCDYFGPDKLDPFFFKEFMDYYMLHKVLASKSLIKATEIILKDFVEWLFEHNYMTEEDFRESFNIITWLNA
jgi:hypothetical protein